MVPVATWIPNVESVAAMVKFHEERTLIGYDGIYIDDYMTSYYGP